MKHGGKTFAAGLGIGVLALGLAPSAVSSTGCAAQQDEVDAGTSSNPPPSPPLPEVAKQLFDELKPAFVAACGKGCHTTAVAFKNAPTFLAPPDEYKAILASGFVTDDATASPLLNQREHEGPALATFPDLAAKVFTWLRFEALVKQKAALPSSGYAVINAGPNEIDMGPAGIPGVKIRFDAQMPGGILSLTKLRIFVPDLGPKKGATLSRPLFYRLRKDNKLFVDPVDTFSYVSAVFPGGGVETPLPPGSAIFAVPDSWAPFQPGERVRIQADKFEIGDVSEVGTNPTCKNVTLFQSTLLPSLMGQGVGAGINCSNGGNCHGGLQNPRFIAGDPTATCINFGQFTNKTNPAQSPVVLKPSGPNPPNGHAGGKVTDTAGFANAWTQAITGGQIF